MGSRYLTRAHRRVHAGLCVDCELPDGRVSRPLLRDVSAGGAFIETVEQPALGAWLKVTIACQALPSALRLTAVVRWTSAEGFGVQWGLLGVRETRALLGWVGELRRVEGQGAPPGAERLGT